MLLVHSWPRKWDVWLNPVPVVARKDIAPEEEMFVTGSRFPEALKVNGVYQRKLTCFLIRFPVH